jgi:intracellular sulfur oxidation DsrE/DsrF family protein
MPRLRIAVLVISLLMGVVRPTPAQERDAAAVKVVVHVSFADSDQQQRGLRNIENVLKVVPGADVVVVCHGAGINLVVKEQTRHEVVVSGLMKKGVRFVACENTMRQKALTKEQLLAGTGTVPTGALEVIRRQQAGYAYFKP